MPDHWHLLQHAARSWLWMVVATPTSLLAPAFFWKRRSTYLAALGVLAVAATAVFWGHSYRSWDQYSIQSSWGPALDGRFVSLSGDSQYGGLNVTLSLSRAHLPPPIFQQPPPTRELLIILDEQKNGALGPPILHFGFDFSHTSQSSATSWNQRWTLTFPDWVPLALFSLPAWAWYWLRFRPWLKSRCRLAAGCCGKCGYDLRSHNPGDKCPECGTPKPVSPSESAAAPSAG